MASRDGGSCIWQRGLLLAYVSLKLWTEVALGIGRVDSGGRVGKGSEGEEGGRKKKEREEREGGREEEGRGSVISFTLCYQSSQKE